MRIFFLMIALFSISVSSAQAVSITALLTGEGLKKLNASRDLAADAKSFYTSDQTVIFRKDILNGVLDKTIAEVGPTYLQEVLYVEPPTLNIARPSDLEVYNSLLNLKSLGLAYMDKGNNARAPLFKNIKIFTDDSYKKPMEVIPPVTSIPEEARYYISMRDERFGVVKYAADYTYKNGVLGLSLINMEKVKFVFWDVAERGEFRISFYIVKADEGYAYLAQVAANVQDLEAMEKRVHFPSFFSRRIEGLKGWIFKEVLGVTVKQGIYAVSIEKV